MKPEAVNTCLFFLTDWHPAARDKQKARRFRNKKRKYQKMSKFLSDKPTHKDSPVRQQMWRPTILATLVQY